VRFRETLTAPDVNQAVITHCTECRKTWSFETKNCQI